MIKIFVNPVMDGMIGKKTGKAAAAGINERTVATDIKIDILPGRRSPFRSNHSCYWDQDPLMPLAVSARPRQFSGHANRHLR